jgi:hypothetical protein
MTIYEWLCARLPTPVVDWGFIAFRALLLVLIVLCSDQRASDFAYLRL